MTRLDLTRRALIATGLAGLALPVTAQDRPVVAVANFPLASFAQTLGGGAVDVFFGVPAGTDPSFWRPSIADITTIQAADLIALNGAGFADWPTKASLPRSRTVDTSAGFADRLIRTQTVTHAHGDAGEHTHEATASYVWLDFALAGAQAAALADAMTRQLPDLATTIAAGRAALLADLAALDARARAVAGLATGPVITAHPRYQYFAAAYGLAVTALEWDAQSDPAAADWAALDGLIAAQGPQLFIWEAAPSPQARAQMAARGLVDIVFPPLAHADAGTSFVAQMQASLDQMEQALRR